ncbi:hypothetical protein N0V88_006075 [Collariella sp. IMI 366227]|nr:hypothetical protein N0V88_006075 [Collariella sp. IMI 366227]
MASIAALHPLRVSLSQRVSQHMPQQLRRGAIRTLPLPLSFTTTNQLGLRSFSNYLVTPQELADALKKSPPSLSPRTPRHPRRTGLNVFREKRIPKARFFDLDKVIDKRSPYPHMLPNPKHFAEAMSELGIRHDDTVVVYDSQELGIFSAPRVGWTMKVFGHPKVHILNNFRLWVQQGLPTESGNVWTVECGTYPIPKMDDSRVAEFEEVHEVALDYNKEGAEGVQVLDARSAGRWTGKDPEPREGLSSGHLPGSINIPFDMMLDPETKAFLSADKLKEVFVSKGVDPEKPIISSCGTGVTACILETALSEAQFGSPEKRKVYDGSWTEWAQRVKPTEGLIQTETTEE